MSLDGDMRVLPEPCSQLHVTTHRPEPVRSCLLPYVTCKKSHRGSGKNPGLSVLIDGNCLVGGGTCVQILDYLTEAGAEKLYPRVPRTTPD